jgi:hypothetical protein
VANPIAPTSDVPTLVSAPISASVPANDVPASGPTTMDVSILANVSTSAVLPLPVLPYPSLLVFSQGGAYIDTRTEYAT